MDRRLSESFRLASSTSTPDRAHDQSSREASPPRDLASYIKSPAPAEGESESEDDALHYDILPERASGLGIIAAAAARRDSQASAVSEANRRAASTVIWKVRRC